MKVEDLTLKEVKQICGNHPDNCNDCPFLSVCDDWFGMFPTEWGSEDMESEVKLND